MSNFKRTDVLPRTNAGNRTTNGHGMQSMGNSKPVNPYRQMYEATNAINKDRVYGNVALNITFPVKGLSLDLRGGTDLSVDWRQRRAVPQPRL